MTTISWIPSVKNFLIYQIECIGTMKVGILGAGLCGLAAAHTLGSSAECVIFEKYDVSGGCMASKNYDAYQLETLYHHCFAGDTVLFSFLDSLGLSDDLLWLKGSTGYYANGKLEAVTTPSEILKWSALTFSQKVRLGMFVLRSRKFDADALDSVTASSYLKEKVGEDVYNAFFAPLLRSKFGAKADSVSAAWLMSRICIRSDRGTEGERLGYLKGGWHRLTDALCSAVEKQGCVIRTGCPAVSLVYSDGKWLINGEAFDAVISTIPPQEVSAILQTKDALNLPAVSYQGAACLTMGLSKDPASGIYWTNMGEKAPYGAVVVHTNFAPYEWYGEHVVYLASYFSGDVSPNLKEEMISDFCRRFNVAKSDISHADLYVEKLAGPVFETGYKKRILPNSLGKQFYFAGMFSEENYPERSMEGSLKAGIRAAQDLLSEALVKS